MAITASNYVERVKTELRINGTDNDSQLIPLIDEGCEVLEKFVGTVTDETLTNLQFRFIVLHISIVFDGWTDAKEKAISSTYELIREG